MKVWYDTEFYERGPGYPILLISIGMVREDGKELYAINGEFPIDVFSHHKWLGENVAPHLPIINHGPRKFVSNDGSSTTHDFWEWNESAIEHDQNVWNRAIIAEQVRHFLLDPGADVELWGWYSAYDHVVLAQLFGCMADLPPGIPMWTNDVRQYCYQLGNLDIPVQTGDEHHALADARWTRQVWEHLKIREQLMLSERS